MYMELRGEKRATEDSGVVRREKKTSAQGDGG